MGWQVAVVPVAYTPQIATDTTARTNTTTTFAQISGDFSIPANDPDVGSVYILTCWGSASFSSTTGQPQLRPSIFGVNLPVLGLVTSVSGTAFTSDFIATLYLIVTAVGVSGSINGAMNVTGVAAGGSAPLLGFTLISATTVNTTAASVFGLQGNVSTTTGGPSLTVNATIYERDGPGAVAQ